MSTRLHIVVSDELLAAIDSVRGRVPRSAWIRGSVEVALCEVYGGRWPPASEQALDGSVKPRQQRTESCAAPSVRRGLATSSGADTPVDGGSAPAPAEQSSAADEWQHRFIEASAPRVRSSSVARPFRPVPKKGKAS